MSSKYHAVMPHLFLGAAPILCTATAGKRSVWRSVSDARLQPGQTCWSLAMEKQRRVAPLCHVSWIPSIQTMKRWIRKLSIQGITNWSSLNQWTEMRAHIHHTSSIFPLASLLQHHVPVRLTCFQHINQAKGDSLACLPGVQTQRS